MNHFRFPALAAALVAWAVASSGNAADDGTRLRVREGDHAPDIQLPAAGVEKALPARKGAETLRLSDLRGKKNVVLYFFPKALTRG